MNNEQKLFSLLILLVVIPGILLSTFSLQALLGQKALIEQKIKESYTALAYSIHKRVLDRVKTKEVLVSNALQKQTWSGKDPVIATLSMPLADPFFKWMYVIDHDFGIVYPKERPRSTNTNVLSPLDQYGLLETAHFWEFQKQDFAAAIVEYQKIMAEDKGQKPETMGYTLTAIARCHAKSGNSEKALEAYQYLTTLFRDRSNAQEISFLINARLQIAELYRAQKDNVPYYQNLLELLEFLSYNEYLLERSQYLYYWQKVIAAIGQLPQDLALAEDEKAKFLTLQEKVLQAREQVIAQEAAIVSARKQILPALRVVAEKRKGQHGYLDYRIGSQHYLVYYHAVVTADKQIAYVAYTIDLQYAIDEIITPILQSQADSRDVVFRVVDRDANLIAGEVPPQFFLVVSQSLSPAFSFWDVAVYLKNIRSLDELSRYRSQIYMAAVVLVIVILVIGIYVTVATFVRQIKSARLQSDFLSNVSHELKTPLTSIKMFVETLLLDRARNKEEQMECLQIIAAETDRLRRLIERILNFAKMEQHKRILHFAAEDVGTLVKETVNQFRNQFPGKGETAEIKVNVGTKLPILFIDREAIAEALTNLLSNSYKYNDKTVKKLEVNCRQLAPNIVAIAVKDNGIGISKQELHRIFQKFYRVENPQLSHVEGTGLGLSLVESIVKAHKGKIKVTSKLGEGSQFTIILPKRRQDELQSHDRKLHGIIEEGEEGNP